MGFRTVDKSGHVDQGEFVGPNGQQREKPLGRISKRAFDVVGALALLILVAPVIIFFALLIRLQDGQRAVFSQNRFGAGGKSFKCFKLRSMVPNAGERLQEILATDSAMRREWEETQKLTDDPRITPLGRLLRKSSIDELPQLLNVLRGDMSLVGPRPIVQNEIERYGKYYHDYTSVQPGITGLWQVKGRSDTTYPERVALDVEYARNLSFWGDIKIMLMTIPAVLFSKGAH